MPKSCATQHHGPFPHALRLDFTPGRDVGRFSLDSQICPRERFGERKVREFPPWSAGVRGCESTIPGDRVSLSRLPTFRTARKSEDVKTGVADNECRDPTDGAGGAFLFIESNDSGGCGCPR